MQRVTGCLGFALLESTLGTVRCCCTFGKLEEDFDSQNLGRVRPGDAVDKGVRWRVQFLESS